MYSNNFYTDAVFNYLGGEKNFNDYISEKLNTNSSEIYFYTGSGLGDNYTTCRLTLRMLEELELTLSKLAIEKVKIMAVPGSDAGTMEKRFRGKFNKTIVAKTGTLNDTSAFSGYILNKVKTRFAVLNKTTPHADKTSVRILQDNIVKEYIRKNGGSNPVLYSPGDYISIEDSRVSNLQ
jgi:D-alanyl-D-alanine carboxypeptidase